MTAVGPVPRVPAPSRNKWGAVQYPCSETYRRLTVPTGQGVGSVSACPGIRGGLGARNVADDGRGRRVLWRWGPMQGLTCPLGLHALPDHHRRDTHSPGPSLSATLCQTGITPRAGIVGRIKPDTTAGTGTGHREPADNGPLFTLRAGLLPFPHLCHNYALPFRRRDASVSCPDHRVPAALRARI